MKSLQAAIRHRQGQGSALCMFVSVLSPAAGGFQHEGGSAASALTCLCHQRRTMYLQRAVRAASPRATLLPCSQADVIADTQTTQTLQRTIRLAGLSVSWLHLRQEHDTGVD